MRSFFPWLSVFALALSACVSPSPGPGAAGVELATSGRSAYVIVLPAKAAQAERHAAEELQRYVADISGARLPIVDDATPAAACEIRLGAARGAAPDAAALGAEGFRLRTQSGTLTIAGGSPRGTLYGVYALLEEQLGCRWFAPDAARIPHQATLRLPALDRSDRPRFEYREPQGVFGRDAGWAARNRVNSGAPLSAAEGGAVRYVPGYFVHTSGKLVPPSVWFAGHPEYYALVKGVRKTSQLCLTHPQVRAIALEEARRQLRQHPESDVISVSQNDGGGWCQCPACQAVVDREGSQAGPVLEFANFIAAGLREEFPSKAVDTLAYYYSEKPPKSLRPLPNVIVRLCSYGCCSSHPLDTCDSAESKRFRDNLAGWNNLTHRIWIWDYTVNYAHFLQPFPNLETLQPNMRYFAAHGVSGVFEEGDYMNNGGELQELRLYLLAKLLWNPDCDVAAAQADFLAGYYGAAAPDLAAYVRLTHAAAAAPGIHVGLYDPPTARYLTPEVCTKAEVLFDRAEAAASGNPDCLRHVRAARLGVDYVLLATWKPGGLPKPELDRLAARFLSNAGAAGVKTVHESPRMTPAEFVGKVLKRAAAQ